MLNSQPEATQHMCMVVQLGYEPTRATRRADAFDCISFHAGPIAPRLPVPENESDVARADAASEEMLNLVRRGDVVMIKIQVKKVEYAVEIDEEGVKRWKQSFVGDFVSLYVSVGGVAEREGPVFSQERGEYLYREIVKTIRAPMPPPA
jgi:hypothetical protein